MPASSKPAWQRVAANAVGAVLAALVGNYLFPGPRMWMLAVVGCLFGAVCYEVIHASRVSEPAARKMQQDQPESKPTAPAAHS